MNGIAEMPCRQSEIQGELNKNTFNKSRIYILVVIYIVVFLDAILLSSVVPIIPQYLLKIDSQRKMTENPLSDIDVNSTFIAQNTSINNISYDYGLDGWEGVVQSENSRVGWLLSSKAITQLIFNCCMSTIIARLGYALPLFSGSVILLASTTMYAIGESYYILLASRAIHGISSALTSVAGLGLLAETYKEDSERSKAFGYVLGGLALGILAGYPYGGVLYDFFGKTKIFAFLAILAGLVCAMQMVVFDLSFIAKVEESDKTSPGMAVLLTDCQILIAAGAVMFPEMSMAMLESTLPLWLIEKMNPQRWQLGLVFIPDSFGYFIGCNTFGHLAPKIGRRLTVALSLCIMAACLFCVPLVPNILYLIAPHFGFGIALGMNNASIKPLLAHIIDMKHSSAYGSVYVISETAVQLGFAIGPPIGGYISEGLGFPWAMRSVAILNLLFCPLCYVLATQTNSDETKSLLQTGLGKLYGVIMKRKGFDRMDEQSAP